MNSLMYTTREGDTVDSIAFALTGRTEGTTEALLALNPHVALSQGPVLPLGLVLTLPSLEALAPPTAVEVITLW
jgi:phage tail protein X